MLVDNIYYEQGKKPGQWVRGRKFGTESGIFGSRGVFGGGIDSSTTVNTIDYITISAPGNATDFGDLIQDKDTLTATSDGSRGVFGGGYTYTDFVELNSIDYITIATPGNATDFGDLTQSRRQLAATSDGSRGVFGGGWIPGYVNTIDYITIATPGNATDFGDLTQARGYLSATSDGSRGVFGGGSDTGAGSVVNTIDYITIATPGNATDFGDLTQIRGRLSATSDGSRGVFGGGFEIGAATIYYYTIDYITIATPGNATDFGDLTESRDGLSATSDGSRGVFGGGYFGGAISGPLNNIDYITIATPGNATDFGDLTVSRNQLSATFGD